MTLLTCSIVRAALELADELVMLPDVGYHIPRVVYAATSVRARLFLRESGVPSADTNFESGFGRPRNTLLSLLNHYAAYFWPQLTEPITSGSAGRSTANSPLQ